MPVKTSYSLFVTISVILWGSVYPTVKHLIIEGVPPFTIVYLRILFSLLIAAALMWAGGERPRLQELKNNFGPLLALALFGVIFFQGFMAIGMQNTQAGKSTLINSLNPAMIVILAHFVLKESLSLRQIIGVIVSLGGVILCVIGDPNFNIQSLSFMAGDLMFVGTALCWTIYTILSRRYGSRISFQATLFWMYLLAFLLTLPLSIFSFNQVALISPAQWFYVIYLGILPGGLCFYAWNRGLAVIGATTCGMINSLLPISAIAISTLWLREQLSALQLVGGVLVILGVWQGIQKGKQEGFHG